MLRNCNDSSTAARLVIHTNAITAAGIHGRRMRSRSPRTCLDDSTCSARAGITSRRIGCTTSSQARLHATAVIRRPRVGEWRMIGD